jgi:hypothetical protein
MKLGLWRRGPGLELHETTFRENAIDETVLPDLTEPHCGKSTSNAFAFFKSRGPAPA